MEQPSDASTATADYDKNAVKPVMRGVSAKLLPTKRDALILLKKMGMPQHIISHQMAVMRKARYFAHNITKVKVDINLVIIGSIMHDIGRIKTHGLDHAAAGGDIIRGLGFPNELARIAETHSLGGFTEQEAIELHLTPRDYMPHTIEEKIVCLADKFISGSEKVTIEERFQRWIGKHGETEFLLEQIRRVKKIEDEILHLIHD